MLALSLMLSLTAIACGGKKTPETKVSAEKTFAMNFAAKLADAKKLEEAKKECVKADVCKDAKKFEGFKFTFDNGAKKDKKTTFKFTAKKDKAELEGTLVVVEGDKKAMKVESITAKAKKEAKKEEKKAN